MKRQACLLILLAFVCATLSSCEAPTAQPSRTPAVSPGPSRTPALLQTPRPSVTATITPASDIFTLTWWTPEFISPKAPAPAGALLAQYLADFETSHNGKIRVNTVLKARYGKGGLLDFLRTTQPVVPGLLPDIVALDLTEIEQAVGLGLLQPLDSMPLQEITPTLYSFARQSSQFDGRTMAMPLVADFEHVVYNREQISQPPSTWAGVLANKIPYLFPVGPPQSSSTSSPTDDVQPAFLAHYVSAGGTLDPRTRRLALQEQPLQRVLSYYRDAREAGLLPANILDIISSDEAWNAYGQGSTAMANVSARRYLVNRDALPNTSYAAAPGWSNPVAPVGGGWALAITTPDAARQRAAAEFIAWLMAPERAGPYAQAAGWLPTAPKALATWGPNPYHEFLGSQLTAAIARPAGPEYAQAAARLQKAITAVLKGSSSPTEAVQAAINPK